MGNPNPYARLANESRSGDSNHDRHGGDGGGSMWPCSGIIVALCCCRLPEDNPRGGMDVAQATRPREAPDQVPFVSASHLVGRFRWSSVSTGLQWC